MSIEIKSYNHSHKQACLAAFQSNIPVYFTPEEINDFTNFLEQRAMPKDNEIQTTFYYVLLKNNEVIGCGGFGERERDGTVTLAWGLVHSDFHKQGFGKVLLQHRLTEARNVYPTKTIYLDTTQFSFQFFEKFGFKTTKITNDFYMKGMHRYDMELV
jgi:N-acetylglutamate synthase-like GNAT family acetyltransferase